MIKILYLQMSSATPEKEHTRKRAKRACESPSEKERRKKVNRERNMLRRAI